MESLNRFPRMMQEYLVSRVRQISEENRERIFAMRSKKAALEYQARLRRAMRRIFGRHPRRTPLNPRVVDVLDREDYTIETVSYTHLTLPTN